MITIAPWAFVLAVPDYNRSAAYFRDILGFRVLWSEATDWRLVERDGVRIMLGHCPNAPTPSETGPHNWFAYLSVNDVDALRAELIARARNARRRPTPRMACEKWSSRQSMAIGSCSDRTPK
jgi:catechol 2,3-dioxygenase-like lactoylglutathione lyase family enzyme